MTLFWLFLGLFLGLASRPAWATCRDDLASAAPGPLQVPMEITVQENTPADTLLLDISSGDSLSVDMVPAPFLKVVDGKLYTAVDVTVDGPSNQELCSKVRDPAFTYLKCKNEGTAVNVQRLLIVTVNFTRDLGPALYLKPVYVKEQLEGVTVVDLSNPMVASDDDCGTSLTLHISQIESGHFDIKDTVISLVKRLDYEATTSQTLNVSVVSQFSDGTGLKKVEDILQIFIEDVDDRDPFFSHQVYKLNVAEELNSDLRWLVTHPPIRALDGDRGINASLKFSISFFYINGLNARISESGRIRVETKLDRERIDAYTMVIKAEQTDNPLAWATATVSIIVDDVNDNRPQFVPDQPTTVTILEGAPTGHHVTWLRAVDVDEGPNAEFDYTIAPGGEAFKVITLNGTNQVELLVNDSSLLQGLDKTTVEIHLVEKQPVQGGDVCDYVTSCVITINVLIEDVNDNSPVFDEARYEVILDSNNNTSVGAQSVKITATDKDKGRNGMLSYSLLAISNEDDGNCGNVSIDSSTGQIFVHDQMNPDVVCYYTVSACDNPIDSFGRRCTMVPLIVRVPKTAPSIAGDRSVWYNTSIPEGLPVGSLVMRLPFNDLQTDSKAFQIVDNLLLTATVLDRETQVFHVVSTWRGDEKTEAVRITIQVDDVNDNSPVFLHDRHTVDISDDAKRGDVVYSVKAADRDARSNVSYSLINMRTIFTIHPKRGDITLKKPAREAAMYLPVTDATLIVEAKDDEPPFYTTKAEVKVHFEANSKHASVLVPATQQTLVNRTHEAERKMSSILGVDVQIKGLEKIGAIENIGSKIYITATRNSTNLPNAYLRRLVSYRAAELYKAFLPVGNGITMHKNDEEIDPPRPSDDPPRSTVVKTVITMVTRMTRSGTTTQTKTSTTTATESGGQMPFGDEEKAKENDEMDEW